MFSSEESCGHRFIDTSHSSSSNFGGRVHRSFENRHSSSRNLGGYVRRGGSRSQENSQYSYLNLITNFYVEGRGGYRSQTSHHSFHNQGDGGRLLTLPVSSFHVEEKVYKREW